MQVSVDDYVYDWGNGHASLLIGDSGANNFGIFGDVFMRNFYVVFDHGNM